MVTDTSLTGFLDVLSSAAPVPGGGGAAAVAGAMAASLGGMVASLTSGKRRYADVQAQVDDCVGRAGRLRGELLALADADAAAFEPLSVAYGLPKGTEGERARKAEVMEAALREACEPPLRMMETLGEVIDLLEELGRIGTRIAVSDVGAGAALASAALRAASLNVLINARSMADREHADALVGRTHRLVDEGCARADALYLEVERGIA